MKIKKNILPTLSSHVVIMDKHVKYYKQLRFQKQENLTSMNQELQMQLQKITEEKQNLTILSAEKDDEIIKLQGEIVTCK